MSAGARGDDLLVPELESISLLTLYVDAFASLDRQELLTLVLTLGVLCFAVTTAIMLVRTRSRAASAEAALRDQLGALRAESDRFNALLHSEPQILVSWGRALRDQGLDGPARRQWSRALAMLIDVDDEAAEAVRALLAT